MSKNVEINIANSSGGYDVLYPGGIIGDIYEEWKSTSSSGTSTDISIYSFPISTTNKYTTESMNSRLDTSVKARITLISTIENPIRKIQRLNYRIQLVDNATTWLATKSYYLNVSFNGLHSFIEKRINTYSDTWYSNGLLLADVKLFSEGIVIKPYYNFSPGTSYEIECVEFNVINYRVSNNTNLA